MAIETLPDRDARRDLALDLDAATRPDRIKADSRAHADHDLAFEQARSVGLRVERLGNDEQAFSYKIFSGKNFLGEYWVISKTLCIEGIERRFPDVAEALLAVASVRKWKP